METKSEWQFESNPAPTGILKSDLAKIKCHSDKFKQQGGMKGNGNENHVSKFKLIMAA